MTPTRYRSSHSWLDGGSPCRCLPAARSFVLGGQEQFGYAMGRPAGVDARQIFDVFDDPRGEDFTVGVEEEFFLVDTETRALRDDADDVLARAHPPAGCVIDSELKRSQVESGTAVCRELSEVRTSVVGLRRTLGDAAASAVPASWHRAPIRSLAGTRTAG